MTTIDVTVLVSKLKSTWVTWASEAAFTALSSTPYTAWLKLPIISHLVKAFIGKVIQLVADLAEMQGFFWNTAIRKASQAVDFVNAIDFKEALPETASTAEYKAAEEKQMAAFSELVRVTR